jgi:hypothetical protein
MRDRVDAACALKIARIDAALVETDDLLARIDAHRAVADIAAHSALTAACAPNDAIQDDAIRADASRAAMVLAQPLESQVVQFAVSSRVPTRVPSVLSVPRALLLAPRTLVARDVRWSFDVMSFGTARQNWTVCLKVSPTQAFMDEVLPASCEMTRRKFIRAVLEDALGGFEARGATMDKERRVRRDMIACPRICSPFPFYDTDVVSDPAGIEICWLGQEDEKRHEDGHEDLVVEVHGVSLWGELIEPLPHLPSAAPWDYETAMVQMFKHDRIRVTRSLSCIGQTSAHAWRFMIKFLYD